MTRGGFESSVCCSIVRNVSYYALHYLVGVPGTTVLSVSELTGSGGYLLFSGSIPSMIERCSSCHELALLT
jgi:hypothetical protein